MNFKKFIKIVSLTVVVCMIILIGVNTASYIITSNVSTSESATEKVRGNHINFLILATDKGGLLTDTIMFASFDKNRKLINIMSLPRDTRVQTKNGGHVKLNAIYGLGKEGKRQDYVIEKVNEILGLPIHYYLVIDPAGFRNVIDILGGVEIDVPMRMYYYDPTQNLKIDLQKGLQVLDGKKAEQFCRFRSGYASADLGRIDAQQMFIKELFKQKLKPKYILKAKSIFKEISENIDTNIKLGDITKFIPILNAMTSDSIETYTLPGEPRMYGDASFYSYDREEIDALISEKFLNEVEEDEE